MATLMTESAKRTQLNVYKVVVDGRKHGLGEITLRVQAHQDNKANFIHSAGKYGVRVFTRGGLYGTNPGQKTTVEGLTRQTYRLDGYEASCVVEDLLTKCNWTYSRTSRFGKGV